MPHDSREAASGGEEFVLVPRACTVEMIRAARSKAREMLGGALNALVFEDCWDAAIAASQAAPVAGVEGEKRQSDDNAQIRAGLDDALAYAQGDTTRATLITVKNGEIVSPPPGDAERLDLAELERMSAEADPGALSINVTFNFAYVNGSKDWAIGKFTKRSDAEFTAALWNAYRSGHLVPASLPAGTGSDEEGADLGAPASPSGSQASPEAPSDLRPLGIDPSRWELSEETKEQLRQIDAAIVKPGDARLDTIIGGTRLVFGCCSSVSPCMHQRMHPDTLCLTCQASWDRAKEAHVERIFGTAQGTEAGTAETGTGSVHEGPVDAVDAPQPDPVGEAKALLEGLETTAQDLRWFSQNVPPGAPAERAAIDRLVKDHKKVRTALAALALRSSQAGEVRDDG